MKNLKTICLGLLLLAGTAAAVTPKAEKKMVKDWRAEKAVLEKQEPVSRPGMADPKKMIVIEGGTFVMGDTWGNGRNEARPAHPVTLGSFEMSACEITQGEMARVMNWAYEEGKIVVEKGRVKNKYGDACDLLLANDAGWNGKNFVAEEKDRPCQYVWWNGAAAYCNFRSEMEGVRPTYKMRSLGPWKCDYQASGYRLPTEAEWEYAARGGAGGKDTKYSGGSNLAGVGWYKDNNGKVTVYVHIPGYNRTVLEEETIDVNGRSIIVENPVTKRVAAHDRAHVIRKGSVQNIGNKRANELGFYDMSGNVSEWCNDWYGEYEADPQTNPKGPRKENKREGRVLRGGSYTGSEFSCRIDARGHCDPEKHIAGFRVVRSVLPKEELAQEE